jgi:hypothetical protein
VHIVDIHKSMHATMIGGDDKVELKYSTRRDVEQWHGAEPVSSSVVTAIRSEFAVQSMMIRSRVYQTELRDDRILMPDAESPRCSSKITHAL